LFEVEIWIDVVHLSDETPNIVCTLFAAHQLPMRPQAGESFSYFQAKDSNHEFQLCTPIGPLRNHSVRVAIDEVSHYAVQTETGVMYKTSLRCEAIQVPSLEDARHVCAFMTEQLGFEFDPYGLNRLVDEA
jgi:hypothetical protein